jgi:hypothetical protein
MIPFLGNRHSVTPDPIFFLFFLFFFSKVFCSRYAAFLGVSLDRVVISH